MAAGPSYSAPLLTSPLLPTSSPEALFEPGPETREPSTSSTPLPASSETSLPSPSAVRQRSLNTSVSFLNQDQAFRSPSSSSIRSHPSILRPSHQETTTPPRSPANNHAPSPQPTEHPVFFPSPKPAQASPMDSIGSPQRYDGPTRRDSQDRRVRSEGARLARHRPSLVGNKKPSIVTGGWHTSESDTNTPQENGGREAPMPPPFPAVPSASFNGSHPAHFVVQDRRKRAQSLMTPVLDDLSHSGEGSGRSRSSSRVGDRDGSPKSARFGVNVGRERSDSRSSRLSESISASQSLNRHESHGPNGIKSPTRLSGGPAHSPLSSAMNSRVPSTSTYFRESHAESSRHASFRTTRDSPNGDPSSSPNLHMHDLPARSREVERLRREEGVGSPESSRKGKGKAKDVVKPHGIASSFGLQTERSPAEQVALNPDQINELLGDSDVGTALRMLQESSKSSPVYVRDKDNHRRLSVSTRSPDTAKRIEPFIATAPPALLRDDDPHSRDRTVSVSSSIVPARSKLNNQSSWDDEAEVARRRRETRRRSSTVVEGASGHVPYTHHLPERFAEGAASSDEDIADHDHTTFDDDRPGSSTHDDSRSHLAHSGEGVELGKQEDGKKKRKGRLSGLFHRRKKSLESITKEVARSIEGPKHHTPLHDKHEHAKSREQYEKDLAIRRLERERREAELMEEQKYRAFVEVSAHPAAGRMADRAISHLRAYYNQVYDSIDNPPRLNYLSVLRWKRATLEQTENRARWKAEQAERHKDPTSFPSAWTGMYNSPNSIGSTAHLRPSVSRDSQPMSFSTGGTGANVRSSLSTNGNRTGGHGSGWNYTIDDIVAYKEANGKVNYFMPPKDDPEIFSSAAMNKSQVSQSNKLDDFRPSLDAREVDLASSAASGSRRNGSPTPRIVSPSMVSVNVPATVSPSSSHLNLTRTTSVETSGRAHKSPIKPSGRTLGHRPHQSMSAMTGSTTNLANMVRAPFHRIREGVRKQSTMPYPSGPQFNGSESAIEESPTARHVRPRTSGNTPIQRTPVEPVRSHNVLRRHTHDLHTDDDRHDSNDLHRTTGLFLKGRFPFHWHRRHGDGQTEPEEPKSRIDEVRDWSQILEREKRFEARLPGKRRPTMLGQEAEMQLARYAADEYSERSKVVSAAQTRVESLNSALVVADRSMTFFLHEIGQIQLASKISAEIDLEFPGLDELHQRYTSGSRRDRLGHAVEAGATTPPWSRSNSPSRRGSRRTSTLGASALPTFYSVGAKPWPRRTIVDKHGDRIDPIRQVEMALDEAADKEAVLEKDKHDAVAKLQGIDRRLDEIIAQKQAVREWLDKKTQAIRRREAQISNLEKQLNAGGVWTEWFGSKGDYVFDKFANVVLAVMRPVAIFLAGFEYLPMRFWRTGTLVGKILAVTVLILQLVLVIFLLVRLGSLDFSPEQFLRYLLSHML